jgi:hypothetical protein
MGCGQTACADDENDWDRFKTRQDIKDVKWDVYSKEAHVAEQLVSKAPELKGILLKLDVSHYLAKEKLEYVHKDERKAVVAALALIKTLS